VCWRPPSACSGLAASGPRPAEPHHRASHPPVHGSCRSRSSPGSSAKHSDGSSGYLTGPAAFRLRLLGRACRAPGAAVWWLSSAGRTRHQPWTGPSGLAVSPNQRAGEHRPIPARRSTAGRPATGTWAGVPGKRSVGVGVAAPAAAAARAWSLVSGTAERRATRAATGLPSPYRSAIITLDDPLTVARTRIPPPLRRLP